MGIHIVLDKVIADAIAGHFRKKTMAIQYFLMNAAEDGGVPVRIYEMSPQFLQFPIRIIRCPVSCIRFTESFPYGIFGYSFQYNRVKQLVIIYIFAVAVQTTYMIVFMGEQCPYFVGCVFFGNK